MMSTSAIRSRHSDWTVRQKNVPGVMLGADTLSLLLACAAVPWGEHVVSDSYSLRRGRGNIEPSLGWHLGGGTDEGCGRFVRIREK